MKTRQTLPTKERLELSKAVSGQQHFPAPEGAHYLPHQRAGIEYCLGGQHIFIADEPGLGKTITALGVANALESRLILVIAPTSLCENWRRESERWLCHGSALVLDSAGAMKEIFIEQKMARVVIISYGRVINKENLKNLKRLPFDLLILDECHALKNIKSQRAKQIFGKGGLVDAANERGAKVLALSGTPVVNRPIEIYGITKKLCPEAINDISWFEYGLKYCNGWQGRWGWDFTGASNLKELGHRLRSHFMLRRTKEAVLENLPEKMINVVYLSESKEARRLISEINSWETLTLMKSQKINFTEVSEARKKLGLEKVQKAAEYIETLIESGHEKIVVFAHHIDVLEQLDLALQKHNPVVLHGGTSVALRPKLVDAFQGQKEIKLFIGSITAAGVGLTLTAASYVVIVEPSYVPGENEQAMDRCHRIGQKKSVIVDFLVHKNSLDARILNANLRKQQHISEVLK